MNLDRFIDTLDGFARNIDRRVTNNLLERLGRYGVEYAKARVKNIDTGETVDSIHYEVKGNKLTIEAGGKAIWLEFGTGVARNPAAYPIKVDGIVGHGEYGKGNGANPDGWYYITQNPKYAMLDDKGRMKVVTDDDGNVGYLAHTWGIEQNLFMYETALELEKQAQEMGLEIISKELRA